jgi:hypothetical protein
MAGSNEKGSSSGQIWAATIGAVALIVVALIGLLSTRGCNSSSGTLSGRVSNSDGTDLVGANVRLDQEGSGTRSQPSDSNGGFRFEDVRLSE